MFQCQQCKELVSFPGVYSDSDPGIFDPDVFDSGSSYTFPGPPIAAFVSGSSLASGSATTGTSASGTATTSAPTATSTKSSGTCKLSRKASSSNLTVAAST
ncbi:hypothetical protein C0989_002370, partial [Termitomyces sp. Mn162]